MEKNRGRSRHRHLVTGRQRTARKPFTLIELLVVIAIIGVLAAMLLPALGKAREMGHKATCQGLIKQVHVMNTLYAEDNDEAYLPTFLDNISWAERLVYRGYLNNARAYELFYCSKVSRKYSYRWNPGFGYVEYNQNSAVQGYSGKKMAFVQAPMITSMFADHNGIHATTGVSSYYVVESMDIGSQYMKTVANYGNGFLGRHGGGDNFVFYDGHVEHLTNPMKLTLTMRGVVGVGNRNMFPFNFDNDADPNG
jgi:prepilin-type N-terminal cleavage/methylation domain-containing protein/prepilin-type processing-associated H-X9-DG protein